MVDVLNPATLRGFHVSVADIGDQMHLCQPLLSFESDTLYFAHRLEWREDPGTLTVADPSEASVLGTLLPPTCRRTIASGKGVVAMGGKLVQAATDAGVEILDPEMDFALVDGSNCWIGVATPDHYVELRTRLAEDARIAFDEELRMAVRSSGRLSKRGNAALFLMSKCGPRRNKDLAIRQLVGAQQNGELALYRRLLVRFEIEFGERESDLDEEVNTLHSLVSAPAPAVPAVVLLKASAAGVDTEEGVPTQPSVPSVSAPPPETGGLVARLRHSPLAGVSAMVGVLVVAGFLSLGDGGGENVVTTSIGDGGRRDGSEVAVNSPPMGTETESAPEDSAPAASEAAAEAERQRLAAEAAERQRLAAEAAEAAAEAERQRLVAAAEAVVAERLAELRRPVFRDCDGCPEMVVIPAGEFRMGSPASEAYRGDDEGPRHQVTVSSFALGVREVTFDEWDACLRAGWCNEYRPDDRDWDRGSRPVINVSWEDAQAYVSWLSAETGAAYRLPSESEWEYAARAHTTTLFHTGATILRNQANYNSSRARTTRAEEEGFAANPFGLYDMHGNVWEWVEDCWHDSYRGAPIDGTAWTVGGDCDRRVLRGGSWFSDLWDLRSANRFWNTAVGRSDDTGFRVARTLE